MGSGGGSLMKVPQYHSHRLKEEVNYPFPRPMCFPGVQCTRYREPIRRGHPPLRYSRKLGCIGARGRDQTRS